MGRAGKPGLVTLVTAALLLLTPAQHSVATSGEGSIAVGYPTTAAMSATEFEFVFKHRCGRIPILQGADAYVIDLDDVASGSLLRIESSSDVVGSVPMNVAYWTQSCKFSSLHANQASPYSGYIPSDARWAVVSAAYGQDVAIAWSCY